MKTKIAVKIIAFTLIFATIAVAISVPLIKIDKTGHDIISAFYEEEKNTLDAVYIGSSNCFTYWNSMLAWKNYGITVHHYAANSNPLISTEYIIKEARKTQPDALYIVNINTTAEQYTLQGSRNVLDCMPFSLNKLNFIIHICKTNDYSFEECLEYYIPLIKFHSRWSELEESDFESTVNEYKGSAYTGQYVKKQKDVSSSFETSDKTSELSESMTDILNSLLDYCDEENVKIVFVTVPQARNEKTVTKFNAINSFISARGYDVIDFTEMADEVGLSYETDYYNEKHTNIHGSIKFTDYFSQYLIDNYGFTDKRNGEVYASWNESLNEYSEVISPYVLDFETEFANRNYLLKAPELIVTKKSDDSILTWSEVDGADGYIVYSKNKNSGWKRISDTTETELTVTTSKNGTDYYTVVPYTLSRGEYSYGNFVYAGIKVAQ